MLPTVTLPKVRLLGLDPNAPSAAPVPERGMARVGLEASEVMVTVPLAFPADVGANMMLKLAICPAVSVSGTVIPLRLNPLPDTDI